MTDDTAREDKVPHEPQPPITTDEEDEANLSTIAVARAHSPQNPTLLWPITVLNTDGSPIRLDKEDTGMLIELLPDQYKVKIITAPAPAILGLPPRKPVEPKSNTAISRAVCGIMLDNIPDKGCRRATVIHSGGLAYIHVLA